MAETIRATNSVTRNWEIATTDSHTHGLVTAAEAKEILAAVKTGGITDSEVALANQVLSSSIAQLSSAKKALDRAQADYDLEALDAVMDAERLGRMDPAAAIAELERTRRAMQEVTDALNGAKGEVTRTSTNLEAATFVRHQLEIARRVPVMVDKLSYGVLDWRIFDSEAKAALDQLSFAGAYGAVVLRELAARDGGKYLRRLAEELPADGKRKLIAILDATDPETQKRVALALGEELSKQIVAAR